MTTTAAGEQPDMLAAALWYAEHWRKPIFPLHGIVKEKCTCGDPECKSPGKHPLTPHGCKDATLEPTIIRAWWAKWPFANIGLATGKQSGVDVLDADPRHYGNETLWRLEQQYGELPATVMGISGSLGPHIYFQHVDGTKNSEGEIGEGLDLRTTGGYAVVPPSLHISGRRYCWEGGSHPSETPVAAFPEWLLKLARGRTNGDGNTGLSALPVPDKIPHGTQHHTLVSFGGTMRRRGADEEEIFAALWAMNTRRCEKPGSEKDIRKMARSICDNYAPDPKANVSNANGTEQKQPTTVARPVGLTVADILAIQAPDRKELVEHILPTPGAFLLVGSHKTGKTVLATQIAISVASGSPLMDCYRVMDKGPVIIVEQDDTAGDLSMRDYLRASPVPVANIPLTLFTRLSYRFSPEFYSWLQSEIERHHAKLAVLDSYTALRPHRRAGGDVVKVESDEMTLIDSLAKRLQCLIIVNHHPSKGSFGMDWSDQSGGTFALGAAVEGLIHIARFRELPGDAPERLIQGRGRHLKGFEAVIRFRETTLDYELVLEGPGAPLYVEITQINNEFGERTFSQKELYQQAGMSRTSAFRICQRLAAAGVLTRVRYGEYRLDPDVLRQIGGRA